MVHMIWMAAGAAALLIPGIAFFHLGWLWAGTLPVLLSFALQIALLVEICKKNTMMKYLIRQAKREQSSQSSSDSRLLYKQTELAIFENQINPHFLYNTLDSIRGEALANGQMEIAMMTEKLSSFFRYCISSKNTIVKISEELRNVQDYFSIQKYRFGDRVDLDISLEDERILGYYIPKISLQPLVENAIAHGIETTSGRGQISIRFLSTPHKIYIYVKDNGQGMSQEELDRINSRLKRSQVELGGSRKHTGIAVQNINSRIRICFGEEYGIHYRSILQKGTEAEIVLPLVDDFMRGRIERQLQGLG